MGSTGITMSMVDHWASVLDHRGVFDYAPRASDCFIPGASGLIARELSPRTACPAGGFTSRQRALEFLIYSDWLIGEAASRHLEPSSKEVERQLRANIESSPGGASQFRYMREQSGRTLGDSELEVKVEMAYARIKPPADRVGEAAVLAYYRAHKARYWLPERRYFNIISIKGPASGALKVKVRVESDASFSKLALHETLSAIDLARSRGGKAVVDQAIFRAKPGVLLGPILFEPFKDHSLFEVTKIVKARYKRIGEVQASISRRLDTELRRRMLADFGEAWKARWISRTDCRRGYVVPSCRQYRGV